MTAVTLHRGRSTRMPRTVEASLRDCAAEAGPGSGVNLIGRGRRLLLATHTQQGTRQAATRNAPLPMRPSTIFPSETANQQTDPSPVAQASGARDIPSALGACRRCRWLSAGPIARGQPSGRSRVGAKSSTRSVTRRRAVRRRGQRTSFAPRGAHPALVVMANRTSRIRQIVDPRPIPRAAVPPGQGRTAGR